MDDIYSLLIGLLGVFVGSIITYYINKKILERQEKIRIFGEINKKIVIFVQNYNDFILVRDGKKKSKHQEISERDAMLKGFDDFVSEVANYFFFIDDETYLYFTNRIKKIDEVLKKTDFTAHEISIMLEELSNFMRKKVK